MYQRVKNTRIKNYFIDILKLNPIQDVIPDYVNQNIQPVVEVDKPNSNIVKFQNAAGTLYTTPSDKDFYLTYMNVTVSNNNLAQTGYGFITVVVDGITNRLSITQATSIVGNTSVGTSSTSLTYPIKVDRNTAITLSSGGTVSTVLGSIAGYTDVQGGV